MEEFLAGSQEQNLKQLLQTTYEEDNVKRLMIISEINVLGTIRHLPRVVEELRRQFEEKKAYLEQHKAASYDPLAANPEVG